MAEQHLATASAPVQGHDAQAGEPRRDTRLLLAVAAYFLAYFVLRLVQQGGLERDEAEIVYLAQDLRLGYGSQPPLYAWLQWLAFQAFGLDRFAVVIVKTMALAAACVAMIGAARPLVGRQGARVATVSLLLFPQTGWEALRIQTHSVLMIALACGMLWTYVALLARPDWPRYLLFGLLAGLALLAKYNAGIFLAGLVGASLLVREHRRVLWNRRAWTGLLAASLATWLVLLPHLVWLAQHPDAAFAGTLHKMQDVGAGASYASRVAQGALGVLSALGGSIALPAIVFTGAAWLERSRLSIDTRASASRFFFWLYALCLLQLALLVLTGVVGTIKERWLMPVLFSLPLAACAIVPALRQGVAGKRVVRVAVPVGLVLLALVPGRTWLGPAFGKAVAAHYPYVPLADALQRRYSAASAIVTDDVMLAGNLRFARPDLHPLLLDDPVRERQPLAGQVLLVSQDGGPPDAVQVFQAAYPCARPVGSARLVLPMQLGGKGVLGFTVRRFALPPPPVPP